LAPRKRHNVGNTDLPVEIIKVCGITSVADALVTVQSGATAVGFNFFPGSPRYVSVSAAAGIAAVVPAHVLRVGIFVNEMAEQIRTIARAVRLDVVQLHGDESPEDCIALADLRVWKAFRIGNSFSLSALEPYACEAFLLDGDSAAGLFGGGGRTFPWPIAREAKRWGRIIVAGGLDASNVADAIREVQPWGVDASSKLEARPGVKDPGKVQQYLDAAKSVK
jgi:phosphoribosylanthranilate isomerase